MDDAFETQPPARYLPGPAPVLCKHVTWPYRRRLYRLVIGINIDGAIRRVGPAGETASRGEPDVVTTDLCALISALLLYGVPLPAVREALAGRSEYADLVPESMAAALVAFLMDVERIEGPRIHAAYVASELTRSSTLDAESAR